MTEQASKRRTHTFQDGDQLARYYDNFTLKLRGMQVLVANPGILHGI